MLNNRHNFVFPFYGGLNPSSRYVYLYPRPLGGSNVSRYHRDVQAGVYESA